MMYLNTCISAGINIKGDSGGNIIKTIHRAATHTLRGANSKVVKWQWQEQ